MVFIPPRSVRVRRSLRKVMANQDRVAALLRDPDALAARVPDISRWSVAQQVEHLVNVDRAVLDGIDRLLEGDGEKGGPKLPGWVTLLGRRIPRGRAKAPEAVEPRGVDVETLTERAAETRRRVEEHQGRIGELARIRLTRPHPVLGGFDARQWILFLYIHERHHLAIVDDILRAARD